MMKNKPDIRFDGFNDAWEQCKFNSVIDFSVPNNTLPRAGLNYENGEVKNIHYGDILVKFGSIVDVNNSNVPWITEGRAEDFKSQWLKNGDVIIADTAEDETTGKAIEVTGITKNYAVSGLHTMVGRPNQNFAPYYLGHYLNSPSYHNSLLPLMQGIKVLSLNKANINKTEISFPRDFDEQGQIGTFFQSLDNIITLHQRELENYKLLKKGFLQKLFPSNGDTNPLIRFDGFTDAWELRRLSELFSRGGSGGTPRSTNKAYYNGKIPFLGISDISNSNGFIDKTEKYITEEGLNNSSAWIVPAGSISLAMYASVGKLAILNTDVATSQAFYNMVFNDENLRNYVYQSLSKANESGEWTKLISTGTQANLNADKVKNFDISKPTNKEEMAMISSFFMDLDNLITLHQRELDNYKELKKGFLQKMFV